MDALMAILTRRSTRNYKPDAVEEDKLEKILNAARQAPSGGNNQTNHFLVIRNRDVIRKLIVMAETAFSKMEIAEDTYASLKYAISASTAATFSSMFSGISMRFRPLGMVTYLPYK